MADGPDGHDPLLLGALRLGDGNGLFQRLASAVAVAAQCGELTLTHEYDGALGTRRLRKKTEKLVDGGLLAFPSAQRLQMALFQAGPDFFVVTKFWVA